MKQEFDIERMVYAKVKRGPVKDYCFSLETQPDEKNPEEKKELTDEQKLELQIKNYAYEKAFQDMQQIPFKPAVLNEPKKKKQPVKKPIIVKSSPKKFKEESHDSEDDESGEEEQEEAPVQRAAKEEEK